MHFGSQFALGLVVAYTHMVELQCHMRQGWEEKEGQDGAGIPLFSSRMQPKWHTTGPHLLKILPPPNSNTPGTKVFTHRTLEVVIGLNHKKAPLTLALDSIVRMLGGPTFETCPEPASPIVHWDHSRPSS